jgi:serine protease
MLMNSRRLIVFLIAWLLIVQFAAAQTEKYIIVYRNHAKKEKMLKRPEFAKAHGFNIIPAMAASLDANEVDQLLQDPDVNYIEPDYKIYAFGGPSMTADVSSSDIEALASTQTTPYGITMVNAPTAWLKTKGAGARVAVLDTGITMYHPDRGNVVASVSYATDSYGVIEPVEDFSGHGTHTAGTIAAADNSIGVVGVAPQASLLIAKVMDNNGDGDTSWLISGIEWAVTNNADVISMSLGSSSYSAALDTACSNAFAAGVLLVAAAGNDNTSTPDYPAALSSVISVVAIDQNKSRASFSNYGSTVDLAAPGVGVYSTVCPIDSTNSTGATANAVWSSTSHTAYPIFGTAAGTASGLICDCGLATGTDDSNTCPAAVSGNIAFIRRGTNYFSEKVAHAQSKGAIGVIIADNGGDYINTFTLNGGTPLVVAAISQSNGDALHSLLPGINGTVSVTATLYASYDGTSMACPHVAGVAALLFAAEGGNISPSEVRTVLQNSAQDLGTTGRDNYYGYGLVNASAALNLLVPHTCDAVWTLGYGLSADIDQDCFVSWTDLQLLTDRWLSSGCTSSNDWCNGSDINNSGRVNISDFSKLALKWLSCNDPQHISCK